jgi:hypothetical protein
MALLIMAVSAHGAVRLQLVRQIIEDDPDSFNDSDRFTGPLVRTKLSSP